MRTGGRAKDRFPVTGRSTAQRRWEDAHGRVSFRPVVANCQSPSCRWAYGENVPLPPDTKFDTGMGVLVVSCLPNLQGIDIRRQIDEAIIRAAAWYHENATGHEAVVRTGRPGEFRGRRWRSR
jgi:hypothetical protein